MPVCQVCDSEDYELLNGLYFCQVCSTQSQEVVEETLENVAEVSIGKILTNRNSSRKKSSIVYHHVDRGKPWYTAEGFQAILKAQVEALIQLGCTTELREVVRQIWLKYIHKSGIAVINPTVPCQHKLLQCSMSFRDQYLSGHLGETCVKKNVFPCIASRFLKLKLPTLTKSGRRRKIYSSSSSEDDTWHCKVRKTRRKKKPKREIKEKPWRSDEEWFSLASDNDVSDSESNLSSPSALQGKKYRLDSIYEHRQINFLSLDKLISILYIALQWCKEPITIGDLVNWIKQGYLPYIDSLNCLYPHMKLTNFDVQSMQDMLSLLSYQKIMRKAHLLVNYVEMPAMPEVDINFLVTRYIIQLNLPLSLSSFVRTLMILSDFKYIRNRKEARFVRNNYKPDVIAVALVVIVMKLLFGLDDVREWLLDKFAKSCDISDRPCQPFTWKRWLRYHLKRRQISRQNPSDIFTTCDPEVVEDVHSYYEHWENVVLRASDSCKEVPGGRASTKGKKELVETKRWMLGKLLEMQGSQEKIDERRLLRGYPYVFPSPGVDSMSQHCLNHVVENTESNDWDYTWYSDGFSRLEYNQNSMGLCSHHYGVDVTEREMLFHQSYDFCLSLASEVTKAAKGVVHIAVQDLESSIIFRYLVPREKQTYSSTSWNPSERLARWVT